MNLYAVWGQDQLYHGLHGMRDVDVIETDDENEVYEYALELSQNVIDFYSAIYEELEREVQSECEFYEEDDEEEIKFRRDEIYDDDLDFDWAKLDKEKLPTLDCFKLSTMFSNNFDEFLEKYSIY